jgi:AcrR family transcriptional regulator
MAAAGASVGVRARRRSASASPARARGEGDRGSRVQVTEMQRSRLLAAMVQTIEELGYAHATVASITARARVSRRTFYEIFDGREDCLVAVLEDATRRIGAEIDSAGLEGLSWRERVRGGLWLILSFLDREPVLARVCVVQALRGAQEVLERREEILSELAAVLDRGHCDSGGVRAERYLPLTAEGLVGAAFAIVYARLLRDDPEPLAGLLPELMGMIVLPYLGPGVARRELARPMPGGYVAGSDPTPHARAGASAARDPLEEIPMRLTYRTVRVLEAIAQRPGVSNRLVGELAGILDQGQISKLLWRLQGLGLVENTGVGHSKGEPNEWHLSARGALVTQTVRARTGEGDNYNDGEVAS